MSNNVKKILIYILAAVVLVAAAAFVWINFRDAVLKGLGWCAIFVIVFFSGWLAGRFGGKKDKSTELSKDVEE